MAGSNYDANNRAKVLAKVHHFSFPLNSAEHDRVQVFGLIVLIFELAFYFDFSVFTFFAFNNFENYYD